VASDREADRSVRARSFGAIAEDYDRLRPSPAPEALDWLVPAGARIVVDVAAGTGLFTRALQTRVPRVIAVEPDPRMRAVLTDRSPGVDALDGTGESIPLVDASVDAVFVSSAWHWLDEHRAVPEMARVLRDGGRLGVVWSSRDREIEWVRTLDRLPWQSVEADQAAERRHRGRRSVGVDTSGLFEQVDTTSFAFTRRMTVDDLVAMTATYSLVITASEEDRKEVLRRARETVVTHSDGKSELDFPMRTWCWRGDRVAR
jgi:SAM-dependent methyltransferase